MKNEYFEWLYQLVFKESRDTRLSYRRLLRFLHTKEFIFFEDGNLRRDSSRAEDGKALRYKFGDANGYRSSYVKRYLGDGPCTVLEMMVALALRLEIHIMDDYQYGDRTGQWFWNMIVALGLTHMSDDHFDIEYADAVVERFLYREYEPNGKGGLFVLNDPPQDLRTVEIWYQAMWYLDENFDFSLS